MPILIRSVLFVFSIIIIVFSFPLESVTVLIHRTLSGKSVEIKGIRGNQVSRGTQINQGNSDSGEITDPIKSSLLNCDKKKSYIEVAVVIP